MQKELEKDVDAKDVQRSDDAKMLRAARSTGQVYGHAHVPSVPYMYNDHAWQVYMYHRCTPVTSMQKSVQAAAHDC